MNEEAPPPTPLLQVRNLAKSYTRRGTLRRPGARVQAVINVSFTLSAGTTLGLAGSSGCGKSTLARCVGRIERPDEGEILFAGGDLARLSSRQLRPVRPDIQIVFQDAATAMNPRFSAAEIIGEPLLIQSLGTAAERGERVRQAMLEVGLPPEWAGRRAHEFSGGQRQRLTLARALVLKPKLLVLDEPLTGLDLSTRAQIINLLLDLQAAHGIAYLFISHDLFLLGHLANRIAVMAAGRLVEEGAAPANHVHATAHRDQKPAGRGHQAADRDGGGAMKSYFARRLARAVLLLFAVSVLCFMLTRLAPGTYFDEIRLNPQISPQTIALLQARYGLNQPLGVRYARWMRSVLRGDFGFSIAYNTPVARLILAPAEHTLLLGGVAMLLCWLIAVPVAVWSARYEHSLFDRGVSGLTSLFISVPEIVLAVGLLALVVRSHVLPVGGMTSVSFDELSAWGKAGDITRHMLAPVAILVLVGKPVIVRHLRASVLEVLHAPFVEAARGCGIGGARLLFRHVLPVAANPAISLFGLSLAALLSGSLLVEVVTGWPGLGPLILDATLARDLDVVVAAAMLAAAMMIVGNLAADLLLLAADPRIRTGSPDAA